MVGDRQKNRALIEKAVKVDEMLFQFLIIAKDYCFADMSESLHPKKSSGRFFMEVQGSNHFQISELELQIDRPA